MAREGSFNGRQWRRFFVVTLLACAAAAFAVTMAVAGSGTNAHGVSNWARDTAAKLDQQPAQDNQSVSPVEINKYIAVYAAMHRDHALTVKKAAAREGMTLSQFRDLENRILREPSVHARVMKALKAAAEARQNKAASKLGHH